MKKSTMLLIGLSALLLLVLADVLPSMAGDHREANKAVLLAFFEAEAQRNYDAMDSLFVENFARHSAASTTMDAQEITSLEGYKAFLQATADMFPDYRNHVQMMAAEGDYVAFYSLFTGTFAQTGNEIAAPIAGIVRFEGEKIAEMWVEWDNVAWGMQMGLVPVSGTLPTFEVNYQPPTEQIDLEANKAVVDTFLEAERSRDYDAMDNLLTADVVRHSSAILDFPVTDREAFKGWVQTTAALFPDFFNTPQIMIAENDLVVTLNRFTGTYEANGRTVEFPSISFVRIADGKITEMWMEFDNSFIVAQLTPTLAETLVGHTYVTTLTQADFAAAAFDPGVDMTGTWELHFADDGVIHVTHHPVDSVGIRATANEYTITGDTLTLGENHGFYICDDANVNYNPAWDGTQLLFTNVDDTCEGRAFILTTHPFVLVPPSETP